MKPAPEDLDHFALARNTDPDTSHQAAKEILGHLGALQLEAAEAVRRHPGLTSQELADAAQKRDPRTFNRRLTELDRLGAVVRGEARRCRVTGRMAATWWPKARGQLRLV